MKPRRIVHQPADWTISGTSKILCLSLSINGTILESSPGLILFAVFEVKSMKSRNHFLVLLVVLLAATVGFGQGKGVDSQQRRITDNSSNKGAANNGTKQDVGTTGSGINFGKEKTPTHEMIPNPYRMTARRDVLMKAVADVMRDRKLILDDASSRPDDGIIVSQPYTFIKGAVVAKSELHRYGNIVTDDARNWTRGRFTITVEVQPIDGINSNVSINAKIEGRTDGPGGADRQRSGRGRGVRSYRAGDGKIRGVRAQLFQ